MTLEQPKNQYCRYCANALDYNGECTDFICTANALCGDNGAGRFYKAGRHRTRQRRVWEYREVSRICAAAQIVFANVENAKPEIVSNCVQ